MQLQKHKRILGFRFFVFHLGIRYKMDSKCFVNYLASKTYLPSAATCADWGILSAAHRSQSRLASDKHCDLSHTISSVEEKRRRERSHFTMDSLVHALHPSPYNNTVVREGRNMVFNAQLTMRVSYIRVNVREATNK